MRDNGKIVVFVEKEEEKNFKVAWSQKNIQEK